jgi:hypothetical protein
MDLDFLPEFLLANPLPGLPEPPADGAGCRLWLPALKLPVLHSRLSSELSWDEMDDLVTFKYVS